MEHVAKWMYYAPGSGVWYNVGTTLSVRTHLDMFESLRKKVGHLVHRQNHSAKCHMALNETLNPGQLRHDQMDLEHYTCIAQWARDAGLDSVQITHHADQLCGNIAIEIMSVHQPEAWPGDDACPQDRSILRSGFGAAMMCTCYADRNQCARCKIDV